MPPTLQCRQKWSMKTLLRRETNAATCACLCLACPISSAGWQEKGQETKDAWLSKFSNVWPWLACAQVLCDCLAFLFLFIAWIRKMEKKAKKEVPEWNIMELAPTLISSCSCTSNSPMLTYLSCISGQKSKESCQEADTPFRFQCVLLFGCVSLIQIVLCSTCRTSFVVEFHSSRSTPRESCRTWGRS